MTSRILTVALAGAALATTAPAAAQLHLDAAAEAGVMKRFLSDRPAGATHDAGFGPTAQLTAHVALLPLLHVGVYFGHDISPLPEVANGDASARNITFGGVRAKIIVPGLSGSARLYAFAGFGYAGVYQQSYPASFIVPDTTMTSERVRIEGAGGSFFDVPFGLGASYKVRKPISLVAELGGRAGFGFSGSVYNLPGPQARVPGFDAQNAAPAGHDTFALGLVVGVMIDL